MHSTLHLLESRPKGYDATSSQPYNLVLPCCRIWTFGLHRLGAARRLFSLIRSPEGLQLANIATYSSDAGKSSNTVWCAIYESQEAFIFPNEATEAKARDDPLSHYPQRCHATENAKRTIWPVQHVAQSSFRDTDDTRTRWGEFSSKSGIHLAQLYAGSARCKPYQYQSIQWAVVWVAPLVQECWYSALSLTVRGPLQCFRIFCTLRLEESLVQLLYAVLDAW